MEQPLYGEKIFLPNNASNDSSLIETMFCRGYGEYAYCEQGKAAYIYLLETPTSEEFALKVFKPNYRTPDIAINTVLLDQYKNIPGLSVANRQFLSDHNCPKIIQKYPDFNFAIKMNWLPLKSWSNFLEQKQVPAPGKLLKLTRNFIAIMVGLEQGNVAHCDISDGNLLISPDFSELELIDIEEIYSPDIEKFYAVLHKKRANEMLSYNDAKYAEQFRKIKIDYGINLENGDTNCALPKPKGTDGYAYPWVVENGYWAEDADRVSTPLLICEMLLWQFGSMRQISNPTVFKSSMLGDGKWYKVFASKLKKIEADKNLNLPELIRLFKQVWFSETHKECPKLSEWKIALGENPSNYEKPILKVLPSMLEFENLNLRNETSIFPQIVTIQNTGEGELTGDIAAKSWLQVEPQSFFSILPGQDFQIAVHTINAYLPKNGSMKDAYFPAGIIIHSNGGTRTMGVAVKKRSNRKRRKI